MTAENNRKYIAEAWVDSKKEQEFIKSYLQNLLEQWEGHGNGFDADTVDEMHWEDIQQTITDLTQGFVDAFQIGYTKISSDAFQYYLGFEAIKLYNIDADGASDEDKKLPWSVDSYTERDSIPNLHEVINTLYDLTYFGDSELIAFPSEWDSQNEFDRTNKTLYEFLYNAFQDVVSRFEPIESLVNEKFKNGNLDADTVNGIRFFIYTYEQYAELEASADEYDPNSDNNTQQAKQDYEKLYSPTNVFILVSKEDLIAHGYKDGYYPNNPDTAIINKFYQFRVYLNPEREVKELQYKFEDEKNWHYICDAKDFLDRNEIQSQLIDILNTSTSYSLNPDAVENALQNTLQEIKDKLIEGAFYDYVDNDNKTMVPIKTINNLRYLDLTSFEKTLSNKAEQDLLNYKERLEGANGDGGLLGDLKNIINSILGDVSNIKNNLIPSLSNKITTVENNISNLVSRVTILENDKKWKSTNKTDCTVYYNNNDVIVSVAKKVNSNKPKTYNLGTIQTESLRPVSSIAAPTHSIGEYGDPYGYIKVNGDGQIFLVLAKDAYSKSGGRMLYGTVTYPIYKK